MTRIDRTRAGLPPLRTSYKNRKDRHDVPIMDRIDRTGREGWLADGLKFPNGDESIPIGRSTDSEPKELTEVYK